MILSICIPNYNRPDKLKRLLNSIDAENSSEIEVVICDDQSPLQSEVQTVVNEFKNKSIFSVVFVENEVNLGFDGNLRALVKQAKGEWIVYMGNDDQFIPGALDKMIKFLQENDNLGYVLRSFYSQCENGKKELFRYYNGNRFFSVGGDSLVSLFRKSVFISGFTIKRELILPYLINDFDGTLLFQLYILGEVVLNNPSAYWDEPFTMRIDEGAIPEFGNAEAEKKLYTPGSVTVDNSLRFLHGYFKITDYFDNKYKINITKAVKKDMSKYFYPNLAIQRNKGVSVFLNYVKELNKIGFDCTVYYYIYVFALIVLGKNKCNNLIRILKNILGKTPEL